MRRLVLLCLATLSLTARPEGRLAAFAAGLTRPAPAAGEEEAEEAASPANGATRARVQEEDAQTSWFGTALATAGLGLLYGGMESLAAVAPEHWGLLKGIDHPRAEGSTLTPLLRVDSLYQSLDNSLDAVDLRIEAGFGPLALQVRRTWYDEKGVDTGELQLTQAHVLYRMQFLGRVGLDVGVGPAVLDGINRYEAVSWTTPVQFRFNENLSAEFRPMWVTFDGSDVRDYELGLVAGWPHFGLKAGYRWLKNADQSLDAPVVGISARW
jgi:hypothetical protein